MKIFHKVLVVALLFFLVWGSESQAQSNLDLFGPKLTGFYAQFKRYDYDLETGKQAGPWAGKIALHRPSGQLHIQMGDQWLKMDDQWLEIAACAQCKPMVWQADEALSPSLLSLILDGSVVGQAFVPSAQDQEKDGMRRTAFSLAGLGLGQREATLWGYPDRPTALEVSVLPGKKTVLQLYSVKVVFAGQEEQTQPSNKDASP